MTKISNFTKIFLDSADPVETKKADDLLKKAGFPGVEGQTTNPSLIAARLKNFQFSNSNLQNFSKEKSIEFYKETVMAIAQVITGPISIQVICDAKTSVEDLLFQARDRIVWIPNGVIKFPCTENGLKAAVIFCEEGPVNMTLVFTQSQAAALYTATRQAKFPVYVSPFVGRLDDLKENGMDLAKNIIDMYRNYGDGHVKVITASVRSFDHLLYAIKLQSDIVSIPYKVLENWAETGFIIPDESYQYDNRELKSILYADIDLKQNWNYYDVHHDLTDSGVAKFALDWENTIAISNLKF
jgi:transaldolase